MALVLTVNTGHIHACDNILNCGVLTHSVIMVM